MLGIVPVERLGVSEDDRSLLKRHAVFLQVAQGFPGVPREHITVYTLIQRECKDNVADPSAAETKRRENRGRIRSLAPLGMTVGWGGRFDDVGAPSASLGTSSAPTAEGRSTCWANAATLADARFEIEMVVVAARGIEGGGAERAAGVALEIFGNG